MRGIDVSNVNGPVDWKAVAGAGVKFAYAKASEGLTYNDPFGAINRRQAEAAGLKLGLYHFARPDLHPGTAGARQEAEHFLGLIDFLGAKDLRPALDLEHPASTDLTAWAATFLKTVQAKLGVTPIFYSYSAFIRSNMGGARGLGKYPLWLADYSRNDGREHPYSTPPAWKSVLVHQFASTGHVPGIRGNVDLDELHALNFDGLLAHKAVPKPAPKYPKNPLFWKWMRWRLGEGGYEKYGPMNASVRPAKVPKVIPTAWWKAAQRFMAQRKKQS